MLAVVIKTAVSVFCPALCNLGEFGIKGGTGPCAGTGGDGNHRRSPPGPHQELEYWATLCPNPALSMEKIVGLSVSTLKQTEDAKAGERW